MRLIKAGAAALLMMGLYIVPASAYDYPVVGEYNGNYQAVFDAMKAGKCTSMDAELDNLAQNEGVSPDIYRAICFFENNDADKGFATVSGMLDKQDYDEALYVTTLYEKKNPSDARIKKYGGIIHLNIGDVAKAVDELSGYLAVKEDAEVRYALVDVYMILKRYDDAEATLDKSVAKDSDYNLRKARLLVKQGKTSDSIAFLNKIQKNDKNYATGMLFLGDICSATGRNLCARDSYAALKGTETESSVAEKMEKLKERQKPYSLYFSFSEEYDNNVTAVDEDEIDGVSEEDSLRSSVVADVKLNFYPTKYFDKISVGLMNFKSWNYSLHSYDMSSHKLYVQGRRFFGSLMVTPRISAGFTTFDGESYSDNIGMDSSFTYKYNDYTFTVPVFVDFKNYYADSSTGDDDKDGVYYGTSFKVSREFMKKYSVGVSAGYDIEGTRGRDKKATNAKFGLDAGAKITDKISLSLSYEYTDTDYTDSSSDRNDGNYTAGIKGMYRFTDAVFVTLGAAYTENDSNINRYDYNKTVISTAVGYMY